VGCILLLEGRSAASTEDAALGIEMAAFCTKHRTRLLPAAYPIPMAPQIALTVCGISCASDINNNMDRLDFKEKLYI
jgi:hypothetical protein